MKRYHVITRTIGAREHLNFEDLLSASCSYVTGVFVTAYGKKEVAQTAYQKELDFPYSVLVESLNSNLRSLFYTYLRSRSTKEEARSYFADNMLEAYVLALSVASYSDYSLEENAKIKSNINDALKGYNDFAGNTTLSEFVFDTHQVFESTLNDDDFVDLMLKLAIDFLYANKSMIFYVDLEHYVQEEDIEVGNVTLLINGNNFILRDYAVVANRTQKPIEREVIPLNEPLQVNSSLKVVYKNTLLDTTKLDELTVKIYIQYEHQRATT